MTLKTALKESDIFNKLIKKNRLIHESDNASSILGTELAHSTCWNVVSANLCIKIALQSTLFQFNSLTICSHATSEHQVRETNNMLKIQTILDWHTFKQPTMLLFPSRGRLVKLQFTLWFSCSCHETLFNKGANCVQWSRWRSEAVLIPSLKREQDVSCHVSTGLIIIQKGRHLLMKFYPLHIIPSILNQLPTGQNQVNDKL